MYETIQSLVQAFLGKFNFQQLVNYYGVFAGYYLLAFLLLMVVFITNVFVSILNEFLAAVGNEKALKNKDHEVVEHFMNTIQTFVHGSKGNKISRVYSILNNIYT